MVNFRSGFVSVPGTRNLALGCFALGYLWGGVAEEINPFMHRVWKAVLAEKHYLSLKINE